MHIVWVTYILDSYKSGGHIIDGYCHIKFASKLLGQLNIGFIQVWWSHNKCISCQIKE